jgi:hypothetical protein
MARGCRHHPGRVAGCGGGHVSLLSDTLQGERQQAPLQYTDGLPRARFRSYTVLSMSSDAYRVGRGHGQEAKRGEAGGQRILWHGEAMGLLPPGRATELSLSAREGLSGATPRGQPWTPAVTLPQRRNGLSARRMTVW